MSQMAIKEIWESRLPVHARAVVAASEGDVATVTRIADAVVETLQFQVNQCSNQLPVANDSSINQIQAPSSQIAELYATVNELSKKFDRLMSDKNQRGRSRSRSNSRNRNNRGHTPANEDECWYHRRYGTNSRKCREPCKHFKPTSKSSQ